MRPHFPRPYLGATAGNNRHETSLFFSHPLRSNPATAAFPNWSRLVSTFISAPPPSPYLWATARPLLQIQIAVPTDLGATAGTGAPTRCGRPGGGRKSGRMRASGGRSGRTRDWVPWPRRSPWISASTRALSVRSAVAAGANRRHWCDARARRSATSRRSNSVDRSWCSSHNSSSTSSDCCSGGAARRRWRCHCYRTISHCRSN
jgi:hypothetical protein